jgi:hypothetical protein
MSLIATTSLVANMVPLHTLPKVPLPITVSLSISLSSILDRGQGGGRREKERKGCKQGTRAKGKDRMNGARSPG